MHLSLCERYKIYAKKKKRYSHSQKVEKRLEEEYERTVHCLSMTTEIKIRTIVETQLIANNLKTLMEVKKINNNMTGFSVDFYRY